MKRFLALLMRRSKYMIADLLLEIDSRMSNVLIYFDKNTDETFIYKLII